MIEKPLELFKTPIWGYVLNGEEYHSESYIDYLLNLQKTTPTEKKSNLGGYQTNDELHNVGIFKEFNILLENIGNQIYQQYSSQKLRITDMWGNINRYGNSNGSHIHGGILSGVFYLKVPENSGNLVFINPAVRSDSHPIREKNFTVVPKKLACIIFPSWLEHYVEPNYSNEERISISFNLGICLCC